jgi:hypothetical protein
MHSLTPMTPEPSSLQLSPQQLKALGLNPAPATPEPVELSTNDKIHLIALMKDAKLTRATPKQARKVLVRKHYPAYLIELYLGARAAAGAAAVKKVNVVGEPASE